MKASYLKAKAHLCGAMLASTVLISGCAFAPGMSFSPDAPITAEDPDSVPVITPITLESVRANNAQVQSTRGAVNQGIGDLLKTPTAYRVEPGDVLSIIVWDHPELLTPLTTYNTDGGAASVSAVRAAGLGYVVNRSGEFNFPYAGTIKVSGLTTSEVQDVVTKRLEKFIRDPQVTIRILEYRSQKVYVDGAVTTPGVVPISDVAMTLLGALNTAGGILPTGDPAQIRFFRQGREYQINIPALLSAGVDADRLVLQNGDVIRVAQREENKIFVMGEVTKPVSLTLRNGHLSLNEALGDAGGVAVRFSDPRQVYVIRFNQTSQSPDVFHLDAKSPVALALAENFQLKSRDVVYVDTAPIVRWNRFISNLLPSYGATLSGIRVAE